MTQGTIKEFDESTRTGSLLTEAREEIAIQADSIGDAAIRTLRIGQRVKFDVAQDEGRAVARDLHLVTFE